MIYFDASYLVRLYFEDPGWEPVRELATRSSLTSCIHGRAEVIAALHRKLREGVLTQAEFRDVLGQFESDCTEDAVHWLPLSNTVIARVSTVYARLPADAFLRAADATHLACAVENGCKEVYSNDRQLLASAGHFKLRGKDVIV